MNEFENMLKEKGASQQQINSKTTQIILSLIAENEGVLPSGTAYIVDKIKKDINELSNQQKMLIDELGEKERTSKEAALLLDIAIKNAIKCAEELEKNTLTDETAIQGVLLYKSLFETSKRMVGEDRMSEAVLMKCIEAASNGVSSFFSSKRS